MEWFELFLCVILIFTIYFSFSFLGRRNSSFKVIETFKLVRFGIFILEFYDFIKRFELLF